MKLLAGTALAALLATPALAQDAQAQADRIAALEAQIAALAEQVAELKAQNAAVAKAAPERAAARPAEAVVSLANGRPTIASSDGRFTASIRGVLQLDAARYDQASPGPLSTDFRRGSFGGADENDRARDLGDGANFRRVRLGIEGKAFGAFDYNFLYDFGGSGVEENGRISAAWVQYSALPVKLRVGAFPPPTGLEDAASSSSSLFAERPSIAETVRGLAGGDGRTGLGAFASGERWNVSAVVTGNLIGTQTFDEQLGFVGRAAFVPLKGEDWLVHLGANANLVINPAATGPDAPGGAPTPVRLRDRPELRVDGTRLIDTGNLDADSVTALGLEFGAQRRNLYLQAEYFDIDVDRRASALSDPSFRGWYVQGSWVLTGEARRYGTTNAGFDGPRPSKPFDPLEGQWGALELAMRYSHIDLDYRAGIAGSAPAADAVRGGEQNVWSLGLNWYLNTVLSLQAAYRRVEVDRLSPGGTAFGAGATPPAGAQVGQDLDILSLRTQYAF
ncbi:MAG: porin [Caulobacteraceae bacterium]|nr:porin [Caulobacteraceae bacterium]